MGVSNFSPIPAVRPSHCPCTRISNAASPRQVIIIQHITILYSNSWHIIYPRRRLPLHYLCVQFLSCEVRQHRTITFVNAFPIGQCPTNGIVGFWVSTMTLTPPSPIRTGLVGAKIRRFFYIAKETEEKDE